MCDIATIAGIALTAGSTAVNTIAQNKVQKARDDVMAAERIRQNTLDQEAQALNVQSQDRYTNFNQQQEAKSQELGDYFAGQRVDQADANAAATAESVLPQSGSNIVVQEEANQRGQARDFTNKSGAALGKLRSFGDLLGDIGRDQARDALTIGQVGGFKRGSSSVVPYELEAASSAGSGMQMLGDVLNLGGNIALNKGLEGQLVDQNYFPKRPAAPVSSARAATPAASDPWAGARTKGASLYNLYSGKVGLF